MQNYGNISNMVLTSAPPQWYDTHACHDCKVKVIVHVTAGIPPKNTYLSDYEDLSIKE